jgi:Tle cognate immunity protein 4 C-terminal domain/Tle cognate immunity protein 4 N-terminal domain
MVHHGQRCRRRRYVLLLVGFLLTAGLSAGARTSSLEPVMMTNNPLLADPRPWCIGRIVMDRPARSEMYFEQYKYWGDEIAIASNVSPGTFQHKVEVRENELRTKKRINSINLDEMLARKLNSMLLETDTSFLEKAVSPTPNSRLLFFKTNVDHPDLPFDEEGYVLAGTTMLTMKSILNPGDIEKSIKLTSDEYQYITYRDDWTVPTERGFCVSGALIGGPSRNSEEVKQSIILSPGRSSMLVINMRDAVDVDQQSSLLKTLPDLRKDLRDQGYGHNVHILREGKRQVAGMDAEEVLISIKDGGVQAFRFYLLAPGNPDSTAQPHTDIQLMLGDPLSDGDKQNGKTPEQASSPVDEAGAIQAWDTLLNSMRLRPGAM